MTISDPLIPPTRRRGDAHRRHRGGRPHRRAWLVSGVLALIVVLVGVGVAVWVFPGSRSAQSEQSGAVLDRVTVSGRQGATPVVTVHGSLDVVDAKVRELDVGDGRTITADSPVALAITVFDGADGANLSTDGRPALWAGRAQTESLGDLLSGEVIGRQEGSRLVFVRRVTEGDSASNGPSSGIEIDVVDILDSVADGSPTETSQSGPLDVTIGDDGPMIDHGEDPPEDVTVQELITGSGTQVGEDDAVLAQYSVTGWSDRTIRDSTWTTGIPQVIDLSSAMTGLREALVDQRVGSRLAVTIPPELATGDDTIIVAIDILAVGLVSAEGMTSALSGDETAQSGDSGTDLPTQQSGVGGGSESGPEASPSTTGQ